MKVLDLFSGGKSLQKPCKDLGHEYFSIDVDPTNKPDMVADIGKINFRNIPFNPDVIWASPPCTCFSVSSIGKHWNVNNTPKTKEAEEAVELVEYLLFLIYMIPHKYYFIENPRGKLRKLPVMMGLNRKTVTYCQYGDDRMKPTDIWTNCLNWKPRLMCKNGDPCHTPAPRGSRTGTQGRLLIDKWKVPYQLLVEILGACL